MDSVGGDPADRTRLECESPERGKRALNPARGLEAAMSQEPMVTEADAGTDREPK
jgi:hypothetical protein